MKLLFTIFLVSFFTLDISAAYLRSIRVASAHTQKDAEQILEKLKLYSQHSSIAEIQEEYPFSYKIKKIQNHYRIVAEPFSNKKIVQKMLDTLRIEYKDAYPKKITILKQKESVPDLVLEDRIVENQSISKLKKRIIKEREEEIIIIEPKMVNEIIPQESVKIKKTELPLVKPNSPIITKPENETNNDIWQILFWILLIAFVISVVLLLKYRRENDVYSNKDIINNEKLTRLKEEMKKQETLMSHVSHELRTPMTAIMGLTHLVLEGKLAKLQRDNIERIESSANHLISIVNDILDVSKIQAGELKIEKAEFNINSTIDYVINVISIQAKKNNNTLSLDMQSDVPSHVIGDSLRLGQVLINLLGNALKFTRDGDITLGIKTISNFNDGVKLEFTVTDTGIGMTEEQIQKIFKSYSQAEVSTGRKFGGTGLGLTISKQLVELMNGEIKVQSTKNVGTTFTFTSLFKLKDYQNKRHYRLPSSSMLDKKVLLVDSNARNITSLSKALEYFKYTVHSIPSFEEAVFEDGIKFDVIIINEEKITELAIEKIESLSNEVKVVILSEIYDNNKNKLLNNINADAHLHAPFTQQNILNLLIEIYVSKNLDGYSRKKSAKDKLKNMSGKKILLAEDNELNHKVISGLLSQSGIEITFVTDGKAAVNLIHRGVHFDMILMDINMPIMDGYEATREIRKNKKYDTMPILALTADVMSNAVEKALNSGMQGHISKPIIVDIFYKKILDTLKKETFEIQIDSDSKDELDKLDEFDEFSVSTGLSRCNNDKEFYISILKDFKSMYVNSSITLESLCKDGNFKDARKMAMDIKDVSLNIGAYNLCESAANMEYEFEKGSRSHHEKLVDFYDISLKKLFIDIDKYLSKN